MDAALEPQTICCIGAGYVGGPTCAVIAANCPDITVHIVGLGKENALHELPVGPTAMTSLVAKKEEGQITEPGKVVKLDDYQKDAQHNLEFVREEIKKKQQFPLTQQACHLVFLSLHHLFL